MGSENLHEPIELLSEATKNMHRAIVSLMEELEAVDWYQQRAEACSDPELKAVLIHNKNEEIEHAFMNLEWIRRNSSEFDERARTYLFAEGPITEIEKAQKAAEVAGRADPKDDSSSDTAARPSVNRPGASSYGSLGIGSLRIK